jgi:hypothetical protein
MKMLLVLGGLLFSITLLVVMQGLTTAHAQTHAPVLLEMNER